MLAESFAICYNYFQMIPSFSGGNLRYRTRNVILQIRLEQASQHLQLAYGCRQVDAGAAGTNSPALAGLIKRSEEVYLRGKFTKETACVDRELDRYIFSDDDSSCEHSTDVCLGIWKQSQSQQEEFFQSHSHYGTCLYCDHCGNSSDRRHIHIRSFIRNRLVSIVALVAGVNRTCLL